MIKDSIAPREASLNTAPTEIWLRAVLRPSVATYQRLVRQPYSGRRIAYIWILVSALIGGVLVSLDPLLAPLVRGQSFDTGLLPAIPIYALIATLFWAIFVGCSQAVARLLRGVGTFPQMVYASATFSAPLIL